MAHYSTSDEVGKKQRRNNRSPPAWEAARCSRAACRAACRAAGSTLAASAAFISSASTAFVCSVSVVIAQFAVRHCELGTPGSHAAPLTGRVVHPPANEILRAVHVGRAEAFELAEAVTASWPRGGRTSIHNRTAPSTASTTTQPLWKRTWRPTLLPIFL